MHIELVVDIVNSQTGHLVRCHPGSTVGRRYPNWSGSTEIRLIDPPIDVIENPVVVQGAMYRIDYHCVWRGAGDRSVIRKKIHWTRTVEIRFDQFRCGTIVEEQKIGQNGRSRFQDLRIESRCGLHLPSGYL